MSLSHLNACKAHIEIQWLIHVCQFDKMKNIIVANIYRPLHGDPNIFIERLEDNLNNIRTMGNFERCILGDINLNYIDGTKTAIKQIKTLVATHGLNQIIKEPTRVNQKHVL